MGRVLKRDTLINNTVYWDMLRKGRRKGLPVESRRRIAEPGQKDQHLQQEVCYILVSSREIQGAWYMINSFVSRSSSCRRITGGPGRQRKRIASWSVQSCYTSHVVHTHESAIRTVILCTVCAEVLGDRLCLCICVYVANYWPLGTLPVKNVQKSIAAFLSHLDVNVTVNCWFTLDQALLQFSFLMLVCLFRVVEFRGQTLAVSEGVVSQPQHNLILMLTLMLQY